MNFEVKQDTFDGPLHILLELIESRELPITEVSLAQVAEAYLTHIEANEPPPPELEDRTGPPTAKLVAQNIDSAQYRMEAMANSKYQSRSLSGLRHSTALKASEVNQQLTELIARGFVSQRQTKKNEPRWFLTGTGRDALAKQLSQSLRFVHRNAPGLVLEQT